MEEQRDKRKQAVQKIKKEAITQTIGYIVAALGLVAGLAWNNAITALIDHLFPVKTNSVLAKFIYAALITIFVVIISIYVIKLITKEEDSKKEV